jgi:hypothetical protein
MIPPQILLLIMTNLSISSILQSILTIMHIIKHIQTLCTLQYHQLEKIANKRIIWPRISLRLI